ncbi:serine O-acetyltransferase [Glaciihabitans tibetensis]|uniref:Serine acetyltransferase n=1 Tax=Glaciihabitans tibetensis TaxID=1266600 RepID=A0A2T0VBA9_9MICO|nr:serine O-acetyltransferase EpsC [Glaciihabitans tibetensis]PRY67403.1 serine O-acetyltransferase [Glaciihabitans tibetensis]
MAFFSRAREDIANARRRDPAARSRAEVVLAYSGLHAIWGYRLTHRLWARRAYLPARVLSQLIRFLTGVEIHPAATIGRRFFIDHGMGVVIGETAVIGDDVMLYHSVTLGGRTMLHEKRHPTLGDGVVVGAGAKIIGPVSIGAHSVVGANAVVVRDAPAYSRLVGVPAVATPRSPGSPAPDTAFFADPAMYNI